jgi:hypothetical protein
LPHRGHIGPAGAGGGHRSGGGFRLARFHPNGSRDRSFGTRGLRHGRREPDQWFGDGLHGQRLNRLAFPLDREQPALDAHSVRG